MWKIVVFSEPGFDSNLGTVLGNNSYQNNGSINDENNQRPVGNSLSYDSMNGTITQKNRLTITSTRVCREELKLPPGVVVVSADSAAADLSSSSMFTLSQVPYLFSTACSDGKRRFFE